MISFKLGVGWKINKKTADSSAPINLEPPVISGTATIGQTLTSTAGDWYSDTGVTGYLYQWYRDTALITDATNNTYVLTSDDVNFSITCQVAATDIDGTSEYVSSNEIILYDVDYKIILDKGISLGYTLPAEFYQKKQSILLTTMKSNGIWDKLDVFYNFARAGSSGFATLNWKNPNTRQCTLVGSLNLALNGFKGTGTGYINTNFNPTLGGPNNYIQDNASRYIYMYQGSSSGVRALDGTDSVSINGITAVNFSSQRINQGNLPIDTSFDFTLTRGMKSIHRVNSTNVELFNGTTQGSRTALSEEVANTNQFILRGFSLTTFGAHTISMYAMGASLVSENTDFVNTYNTYLN
jgi:hypothetical protein